MVAVSVVIPTYNHARYLPDAINSVLAQTFTDWEALIVDDGSTDNTREVAAQFTDPRIRYVYQENRGLSGARNTGIAAAHGELIALLDADDMWEPEFLRSMVTAFKDDSYAAAYCGFQWMDDNNGCVGHSVLHVVAPDKFREELLSRGNWISACSVMVRTAVYISSGCFDESLRAYEDYEMWLRISRKHRFVGVPEVLVRYRRIGRNMSDDADRMATAIASVLTRHLELETRPAAERKHLLKQISARAEQWRLWGHIVHGRYHQAAQSLMTLQSFTPGFPLTLDCWYSVACVHQPVGQRGDFETFQPSTAEADVLGILESLTTMEYDNARMRIMVAQAYFSLALLCYGKRCLSRARRNLLQSFLARNRLESEQSRVRLALKLIPGVIQIASIAGKGTGLVEQQVKPRNSGPQL